jgi:CheY-like chemotaxis protein
MPVPEQDHYWPDTKILIVEDDEFSFQFIKAIFSGRGPDLVRAKDGAEALRIFRSDVEIRLILMDINIPVIDGLEVTRQIRAENADIPIIAQTAFIHDDEEKQCMEAGCTNYISKPINLTRLLDLVGEHLG